MLRPRIRIREHAQCRDVARRVFWQRLVTIHAAKPDASYARQYGHSGDADGGSGQADDCSA